MKRGTMYMNLIRYSNFRLLSFSAVVIFCASISIAKTKDMPKFSDYPVNSIYKGFSKIPTFRHETADTRDGYIWKLKEQMETMKDGPDFAGHFFFLQGGCGTDCTFALVADNKTGKYYRFPVSGSNSYYKYKLNSRLIIETSETDWGNPNCILSMYVMNDQSLKRIYRRNLGPISDKNGNARIDCADPNAKSVGNWYITSTDGKYSSLFNQNAAGDEFVIECLAEKIDNIKKYNQLSRDEKDMLNSDPHISISIYNKKISTSSGPPKNSEIKISVDEVEFVFGTDDDGITITNCDGCGFIAKNLVNKLRHGKKMIIRLSDGRVADFALDGAQKVFGDLACKPFYPKVDLKVKSR